MAGFRQIAEQDLSFTLEDSQFGFGYAITVTDPDGLSKEMNGQSNDVGLSIDPDTGVAVSGRSATVFLRLSTLETLGFTTIPQRQTDKTKKPWIIEFNSIGGKPFKFTVKESQPDRTLGGVLLILELYKS